MPGMEGTMKEFKSGTLHSGSKTGPVVHNRRQAIAIGMNSAARAGLSTPEHDKARPTRRGKKPPKD